jgi:hypothetical protein
MTIGNMGITVQEAIVYKASNGRRYLTKRTAFHHDAVHRLSRKHGKAGCRDWLEGGEHRQEEFYTDAQWDYFRRVSARYWRRFSSSVKNQHQSSNSETV